MSKISQIKNDLRSKDEFSTFSQRAFKIEDERRKSEKSIKSHEMHKRSDSNTLQNEPTFREKAPLLKNKASEQEALESYRSPSEIGRGIASERKTGLEVREFKVKTLAGLNK